MALVGAFFGGLGRAICFATSWIFCFPCMLCLSARSREEKHKARRRQEDLEALSIQESAVSRGVPPARHWPAEQPYVPLNQTELLDSSLSFSAECSVELTPPRQGGLLSESKRQWVKRTLSRMSYARSSLSLDEERGQEITLGGWKPQEEVREIYPEPDEGINSTLGLPADPVEDLPTGSGILGAVDGISTAFPSHDTHQGRLVTCPPLMSILGRYRKRVLKSMVQGNMMPERL